MPDAYECPHCLGQGRVDISGNNPQPYYGACPECEGSGELSAEQMLDYCLNQIRAARNVAHTYWPNREIRDRHLDNARHWIGWGKKARATITERDHAGAGHIGREAA
jgi:hypothetical protein